MAKIKVGDLVAVGDSTLLHHHLHIDRIYQVVAVSHDYDGIRLDACVNGTCKKSQDGGCGFGETLFLRQDIFAKVGEAFSQEDMKNAIPLPSTQDLINWMKERSCA